MGALTKRAQGAWNWDQLCTCPSHPKQSSVPSTEEDTWPSVIWYWHLEWASGLRWQKDSQYGKGASTWIHLDVQHFLSLASMCWNLNAPLQFDSRHKNVYITKIGLLSWFTVNPTSHMMQTWPLARDQHPCNTLATICRCEQRPHERAVLWSSQMKKQWSVGTAASAIRPMLPSSCHGSGLPFLLSSFPHLGAQLQGPFHHS